MDERPPSSPVTELIRGDANIELASDRTVLAIERTRMASDRTLMAQVRTSLSLIGFGFTIYQVLGKASAMLPRASETARNAGLAMLLLGVAILVMGIVSHAMFDRGLARRRDRLFEAHLLRHPARYLATPTYLAAVALLIIGLAITSAILLRLLG
jgi:putative membrane protein